METKRPIKAKTFMANQMKIQTFWVLKSQVTVGSVKIICRKKSGKIENQEKIENSGKFQKSEKSKNPANKKYGKKFKSRKNLEN